METIGQKPIKPMLAQDYHKQYKKIEFPCVIQPKLDGIRMLAIKLDEENMLYLSRTGKEFTTLKHLDKDLLYFMKVGEVFDGELYTHGVKFEDLVSYVKRLQPDTETVSYYIYDVVSPEGYWVRYNRLRQVDYSIGCETPIKILQYYIVKEEDDIHAKHTRFIYQGYEGSIIRNFKGGYKHGRSMDLQKYKDFHDEEYEIVGGHSGKGKFKGCVVFELITKEGRRFNCVPIGSYEHKKHLLDEIDQLIGKHITVKYQEKTKYGVPRFPVGLEVRTYE